MCASSASFTCNYLELFHPGGRQQKPSEDVRVLKKPKLEEGKGFMYIQWYILSTLDVRHGSSITTKT